MGSGAIPLHPAWDVSHGLVQRPDRGRVLPVSPWAARVVPRPAWLLWCCRAGAQVALTELTYVPTAPVAKLAVRTRQREAGNSVLSVKRGAWGERHPWGPASPGRRNT